MDYEDFKYTPGQSVSVLNNDSEWNKFLRFDSDDESKLQVFFKCEEYCDYVLSRAYSAGYISSRHLGGTNYNIELIATDITTTYRNWAETNEPICEISASIYAPTAGGTKHEVFSLKFLVRSPFAGHIESCQYFYSKIDKEECLLYTIDSSYQDKTLYPFIDYYDNPDGLDKVEMRFNHYKYSDDFFRGMPHWDYEAEGKLPCLRYEWKVQNFASVSVGQLVCEISRNPYGDNCSKIEIYSPKTGIIVIGRNWDKREYYYIDEMEIDDLFSIYTDSISLLKHRFISLEEITKDTFDGTISLTWDCVAGRDYDGDDEDFMFKGYGGFEMCGDSGKNIIVSLRVQNNIPYIVFCVDSKKIRLSNGDFVDMQFKDDDGNNIVLTFPITQNRAEEKFADIYDVAFFCDLSESDADCLYMNECVGWRIRFSKQPMMQIRGENGSRWCPKEFAGTVFGYYAESFVNLVANLQQEDYPIDYSSGSRSIANAIPDDSCYVYLMHDISNGYYKIGISNNPEYRERTLQSEKPTIEKVCAKEYPNRTIASAIESALHKAYESKRIRGEWFYLDETDVLALKATLGEV